MEKTDREKQLPGTPTTTPVDEGDGVGATSSSSSSSQPPNATSNNPLYCSYVDGQFTYKDPNTNNQYVWNEDEKKWVVKAREGGGGVPAPVDSNKLVDGEKNNRENVGEMERGSVVAASSPGTSQVQFDGENYTYTDQDGTVFLWDSAKAAWFPKDALRSPTTEDNVVPQAFRLPPSPPDLSSCTTSNQTLGFFNPNYSTQLTSPTTTTTTTACGEQVGGGDSSGGGSRRFYYASLSPTTMGVNDQPGLFLSPDDQVNNNDQVPEESTLPPGWEKHDDSNGPYYWHIKSGTIQRERPSVNSPVTTSIVNNPALMIPGGMSGFVRRSNTMGAVASAGGGTNSAGGAGNLSDKRRSWVNYLEDTSRAEQLHQQHQYQQQREDIAASLVLQPVSNIPAYEFDKHTLKFAAVSLGCLSISEEDLTPERSSRAVSKVIAELTNPGCKGEHRERVNGSELASRIWTHTENASSSQMYLELTDSHLRVKVHRDSTSPLTVLEQPIHSIRVWGVGREDPRDFAFVAREKQTRQFLCHVFRLEMYARPLASSLRDACKKIMIERNARGGGGDRGASTKRPTTLGIKKPAESARGGGGAGGPGAVSGVGGLLFPTPMDEPRKVIKAFYLGSKAVCKPTGMDVLNAAIDTLRVGGVDRVPVLVSVAPSVIGITSTESPPKVELEVRVRFLSFMGIGSDIRTCGIIIHTARDDFEAHCFYSTPSTGALCKAIEAACVLRYQKCLDAHTHHGGPTTNNTSETVKQRSNSICDGGGVGCGGGGSGSTATSPKSASVIASATASNLASALKTVFSSFGKAKSEEK